MLESIPFMINDALPLCNNNSHLSYRNWLYRHKKNPKKMTTEYNTSICQLIYIPLLVLQVSGMLMWNNDPLGCYNANGTPTIKNGIDFDSADHS